MRQFDVPIRATIWAAFASCLSMMIGWYWDISWHRSIGRDTAWTLPHLCIYAALVIAAIYNVLLVLAYTFGARREQPALTVWGFRAPSGCFITLWSLLFLLPAIFFDNWWHASYGLDVGVFSPPHFMLAFALSGIYVGQFAYLALFARRHREEATRRRAWRMAVVVWGLFLAHQLMVDPQYGPNVALSLEFLIACAVLIPFTLVLAAPALRWRWAPLAIAGVYTVGVVLLMQVFQLFPATPGLAPVHHELPNFLPPQFPLPVLLPAAVVTFVLVRGSAMAHWKLAALLGLLFVLTYQGGNWLHAQFLQSEWSHGRLFGGHYPGSAFTEGFKAGRLMAYDGLRDFLTTALAVPLAAASAWFGLKTGEWIGELER